MKLPIRLLFLCTGNSCRSIIGEALANYLGDGRLMAFSAGSQPTGKVNEHALAVLARHNVFLRVHARSPGMSLSRCRWIW